MVLFPRTRVPLHVFEPRYRQMTETALRGDRRIGMVAVPPEHADEMAGDPPVYPVGCFGVISEEQRLADGRYKFVLVGKSRFRIHAEPPRPGERLYRIAEVERLDDLLPPDDSARAPALRSRVFELLSQLLRGRGGRRGRALREQLEGLDDATFADVLSQSLALGAPEKQALLEADGVTARLEQLTGLLEFRLTELRVHAMGESPTLH